MSCRREMHSVVMMLPALSLGYFKISLMDFLVSLSACIRMRLTTFAGISSIRSTVSSTNRSSKMSFNSWSENERIKSSCCVLFISTNVSAASSLGSRRKMSGSFSSSISAKISAMSIGLSSDKSGLSCTNFLYSKKFKISTILSFRCSGSAFKRTSCTTSRGMLSKSSSGFSSRIWKIRSAPARPMTTELICMDTCPMFREN